MIHNIMSTREFLAWAFYNAEKKRFLTKFTKHLTELRTYKYKARDKRIWSIKSRVQDWQKESIEQFVLEKIKQKTYTD